MKVLEKVLHGTAAIILFLMFALCVMQVVFRFILKISAPWTEEFARMGYIWLVYLMLPVLEFNDDQLKVTYFLDKFPYRLRVVVYWKFCIYILVDSKYSIHSNCYRSCAGYSVCNSAGNSHEGDPAQSRRRV